MVPEGEAGDAWRRLRREQSQREAETLVPRPGHPIYGVTAPSLTPAVVTEHSSYNGEWVSITVAYGPPDAPNGPYVAVTTEATDAGMRTSVRSPRIAREEGPEGDLRNAVDLEQHRPATWAGASATEAPQADPPAALVMSRESVGPGTTETALVETALVGRSGDVWAARLEPSDPALSVVVTIVGRGVALESVELQTVSDLRPMIEAGAEIFNARIERARREPRPPLPELEPAEGVAAFRALAEFTLGTNAQLRASRRDRRAGGGPRPAPDWGGMHSALWQRAVREQRRLRGTNAATADYAVTEAVNHLGFLAENAPWFSSDARLREAAIDETLRHAMLGDAVPSETAQEAWARHWSAHLTRLPLDRESRDLRAEMADLEALTAACLRAWASWAETA
jgi:hypothetical protein